MKLVLATGFQEPVLAGGGLRDHASNTSDDLYQYLQLLSLDNLTASYEQLRRKHESIMTQQIDLERLFAGTPC
jgi:hypothetical protein